MRAWRCRAAVPLCFTHLVNCVTRARVASQPYAGNGARWQDLRRSAPSPTRIRSLTKMTFVFVHFRAYVSPAKTEQRSPSSLLLSASARTRQHTLARPKDYQSRVSLGPSAHTAGLSRRPRPSALRGLVRSGIPSASGAALDLLGRGRIRHAVNLRDDVDT